MACKEENKNIVKRRGDYDYVEQNRKNVNNGKRMRIDSRKPHSMRK